MEISTNRPSHATQNKFCVAQRCHASRKNREKVFQNYETRVPLDREAKVRIMAQARGLKRRTEKGKHYGVLTQKHVDVLEVLLRLRTPATSKQIAGNAYCSWNTVPVAIRALESAGILSTEPAGTTCVISFVVPQGGEG